MDSGGFRQNLIDDMKQVFGSDNKRIEHALLVLHYAERIAVAESVNDPGVVIAAAILHDIGIPAAERKHNSSAGRYQEIEGPPVAHDILTRYPLSHERREHICAIIANHHSAREIDTTEFRCVWDADWLVNIPVEYANADDQMIRRLIDRVFRTETGRSIAIEEMLEGNGEKPVEDALAEEQPSDSGGVSGANGS